ncbi:MAG: hypothetical protein OXT71_22650 [Acidobacteriota bacterium]|nr:hypothetical protein [Acidobacteriota bacterium]
MQHIRQPAHRSGISWRGAIPALSAMLVLATGMPAGAASDDSDSGTAETYTGIFIGSGLSGNRIVDIEGFANWGQPGYRLDYGDNRFVAGVLLGTKFGLGGVRLRVEFDGTFGDLSGRSNRLDPEGLDETAGSNIDWVATGRVGFDLPVGVATAFATAGLAAAGVTNFVTDIDSGRDILPHWDPDDSFRAGTTGLGPVIGAGIEAPLTGAWRFRIEGSFLDFGWSTHTVNHSGNNRCGPGNPRRPCPYKVRNRLGIVRFGLIHRFGP